VDNLVLDRELLTYAEQYNRNVDIHVIHTGEWAVRQTVRTVMIERMSDGVEILVGGTDIYCTAGMGCCG